MQFRYRWQIQSRAASLLFAGAVLLLISYIFIALLAKDTYHAHRLATDGRMATATVTKKVVHRASDNGTSNTSYEVNYSFSTADGRRVEGSDTVDPDIWERIADRGPVDVAYAASDPTINRIGTTSCVSVIGATSLIVASALGLLGATLAVKGLLALRASPESADSTAPDTHAVASHGWTTVVGPPLLQFPARVSPWIMIGGILLVCGLTLLLLNALYSRQERLFHAEGMRATAIVLTKSSHVDYNQQNRLLETKYDVSYRFISQDGESVQGSDEVDWRTWKSIRERDPIQIVYLAARPARNRLVATDPGAAPSNASMLGGALTVGGGLLLGCGLYDAMRRHRKNQQ
jgi:methionine-rich copper-binding protein CopC